MSLDKVLRPTESEIVEQYIACHREDIFFTSNEFTHEYLRHGRHGVVESLAYGRCRILINSDESVTGLDLHFEWIKTPSRYCKDMGIKRGLKAVSDITGEGVGTLANWHYDKPKLFHAVLVGVIEILKLESNV